MSKVRNTAQRKPSEYFEGPAIDRCPSYEAMVADAKMGSLRLKLAIEFAGLRP